MEGEERFKRNNHLALSAYNQKNAKDLVQYLHAYAVYPVIGTWIKAIKKEYYSSWSKLVRFKGPQWVEKSLSKSFITTMNYMKATRQGIKSTKKKEDDRQNLAERAIQTYKSALILNLMAPTKISQRIYGADYSNKLNSK